VCQQQTGRPKLDRPAKQMAKAGFDADPGAEPERLAVNESPCPVDEDNIKAFLPQASKLELEVVDQARIGWLDQASLQFLAQSNFDEFAGSGYHGAHVAILSPRVHELFVRGAKHAARAAEPIDQLSS
jgi:hypothetical protein